LRNAKPAPNAGSPCLAETRKAAPLAEKEKRMFQHSVFGVTLLAAVLLALPCHAQTPPPSPEEDHRPSILGLQVGMTAGDVLDRLKRQADGATDQKSHTILTWKLAEGNLLRVDFWKEHIAGLRLVYKHPRPTTDLWLTPLATPASSSSLTLPDPRWRRDYKATEDNDKLHVVWTRDEKSEHGYRVRIAFWSVSKKAMGERYGEFVEIKDVGVDPEDVKRFEESLGEPKEPIKRPDEEQWSSSASTPRPAEPRYRQLSHARIVLTRPRS